MKKDKLISRLQIVKKTIASLTSEQAEKLQTGRGHKSEKISCVTCCCPSSPPVSLTCPTKN